MHRLVVVNCTVACPRGYLDTLATHTGGTTTSAALCYYNLYYIWHTLREDSYPAFVNSHQMATMTSVYFVALGFHLILAY